MGEASRETRENWKKVDRTEGKGREGKCLDSGRIDKTRKERAKSILPLRVPLSVRTTTSPRRRRRRSAGLRPRRRLTGGAEPLESSESEEATFDLAVKFFNRGEFYRCHDVVEEMWYSADEPVRTLLHGVLQCAVGFHHLLNQVRLNSILNCFFSTTVQFEDVVINLFYLFHCNCNFRTTEGP